MTDNFEFLDPGKLLNNDLELVLIENIPATPSKGYVPGYEFEMRSVPEGISMGYFRLRIGDADTVLRYPAHVGYGVKEEFQGHRYAARSLRLILPFARAHGLNKLWIGCRPENKASRRTCEIAGAWLREIVDIPEDHEMYKEGIHTTCRYCINLVE